MKRIFISSCVLLISCLTAYGQGIVFTEGTWADVLSKAKKERKPILVDAYTVWCGPCKKMSNEVFPQESVGTYINQTFVSHKMDMEKGEGIAFAKKYDVTAFPTFLYFNENGALVNKVVGYKESDGFIKSSKEAIDPKNQITHFTNEYEASDRSLKNTIAYCEKLFKSTNYGLGREVASSRLQNLTKKERYTEDEWLLMTKFINDYNSPIFRNLLVNKKKYTKQLGSETVDKYIHFILANNYVFQLNIKDSGATRIQFLTLLEDLKKYVNTDYYVARAEYFFHLDQEDSLTFYYAKNFLDRDFPGSRNDGKLSYYLVYMANRYVDKDGPRLEAAHRWALKSRSLDSNDYKAPFLLAKMLYKKGEYPQSLELAQQALALEKNSKEAGVIKQLFKANTIDEFIKQVKQKI